MQPDEDETLLSSLRSLDLEPPSGELRRRILERTTAVVRARARRRRLAIPLGAVLTFAVGFCCAWTLRDAPSAPTVPRQAAHPAGRSEPVLALAPEALLAKVSEAPRAERRELLKRAGDSYLALEGNMEKALDCYRQFIEITPAGEALQPNAADPWLLEALKLARTTQRRR